MKASVECIKSTCLHLISNYVRYTKTVTQSFPNGSAGRPDGLRPLHLKDLLIGAPEHNPLLISITEVINLLLRGATPSSIRNVLFGSNLLATRKKTGGVRSIAVNYV